MPRRPVYANFVAAKIRSPGVFRRLLVTLGHNSSDRGSTPVPHARTCATGQWRFDESYGRLLRPPHPGYADAEEGNHGPRRLGPDRGPGNCFGRAGAARVTA